ncbi:hypothetical protein GGR50DRAFT_637114 [Xylaria sp. CBS 124048]|nr:hypothetical protein GGR50DRAFT_637114 [Xylaria sp. CBS 124048]
MIVVIGCYHPRCKSWIALTICLLSKSSARSTDCCISACVGLSLSMPSIRKILSDYRTGFIRTNRPYAEDEVPRWKSSQGPGSILLSVLHSLPLTVQPF